MKNKITVLLAMSMLICLSSVVAGYTMTKVWDSGCLINDTINTLTVADMNNEGKKGIIAGGSKIYIIKYEDNNYSLEWNSNSMINDSILSLNVADLNRDNKIDIIAGTKDKVHVLKNNGGRNYTKIWDSSSIIDGRITSVAVDDTNNDGKTEVIVGFVPVCFVEEQICFGSKIYIFEESGNDTYNLSNKFVVRGVVRSIIVDDVDNDMKRDIIVGATNNEEIYYKDGRIYSFFEKTESNQYIKGLDGGNYMAGHTGRIIIDDTDKDGKKEIIANGQDTLHIFENIRDHNYEITWSSTKILREVIRGYYDLTNHPYPVVTADSDNDGRIEIIVGNSEEIYVYENYGDDKYRTDYIHHGYYNYECYLNSIEVADINNDGKNEIITACGRVEIFEVEPAQSQIDLSLGLVTIGPPLRETKLGVHELRYRRYYIYYEIFDKQKRNILDLRWGKGIWLWEKPEIDIVLDITNTNSIMDAENVTVGLFVDGVLKEKKIVDVLSDQRVVVHFDWNPYVVSGKHRIEVRIDPDDQIKEQNETNNMAYEYVEFSLYDTLFYPFKRLIILLLLVIITLILFKKYLYGKIKTKVKGGK